jgi:DNA-binding transcriptional LysR family regulator
VRVGPGLIAFTRTPDGPYSAAQALVSRSTATPTAAGETLVRRARAILADHDQAVAEVIALGNNGSIVAGRIRVGVPLELRVARRP